MKTPPMFIGGVFVLGGMICDLPNQPVTHRADGDDLYVRVGF
jgi:hypothetical protein